MTGLWARLAAVPASTLMASVVALMIVATVANGISMAGITKAVNDVAVLRAAPTAVGAQGPAGPLGRAGADGEDGRDGTDGARGPRGARGPAGKDGSTGPRGPKGEPGGRGPTGPAGPQGPAGQIDPQSVTCTAPTVGHLVQSISVSVTAAGQLQLTCQFVPAHTPYP